MNIKNMLETKCEIHLKIDTTNHSQKDNFTIIKGTTSDILAGIGLLVEDLIKAEIPKELIEKVVNIALKKDSDIGAQCAFGVMDKENARKFMDFMDSLMGGK